MPPRRISNRLVSVSVARIVADHFRVSRSTSTLAGPTSAFTVTLSPLRVTITGRELMMSSAE